MLVQLLRLIVRGLQDCSSSHRSFRRRDESEVLASNPE